jgi:hypothetical protein
MQWGILSLVLALPAMGQDSNDLRLRKHGPLIITSISPDAKTVTSGNWSGYAAVGKTGSVKTVRASWTVPTVNCANSNPNSYAAIWVGIDGAGQKDPTVQQTGTDSDCQGGKPSYFAWYELYPKPPVALPASKMNVTPGDHITAMVTHTGTKYVLVITNSHTKQTFHTSAMVGAAKAASAEWIAEAPADSHGIVPLADFGTVEFGMDHTGVANTCTATIGSVNGPLSKLPNLLKINLVTKSVGNRATPSALSSDGTSFSVAWKH